MLRPSLLCLPFLLLFTTPIGTLCSKDIVDQTCQKCANQSAILSYTLCSMSLPLIPVSRSANLQGLALVAMELALENVTGTLETIDKLLDRKSSDEFTVGRLNECLELYSDAAWTIVNSIGAFLNGNYDVAATWMGSVMESASTCQEGFGEKGGEVSSPLTKENYNLFQLCGIALCIIHMSMATTALPS